MPAMQAGEVQVIIMITLGIHNDCTDPSSDALTEEGCARDVWGEDGKRSTELII